MPTTICTFKAYPPEGDGLYGVVVPEFNVVASGASMEEALTDALVIMQELMSVQRN